jgi:hypothetical protein
MSSLRRITLQPLQNIHGETNLYKILFEKQESEDYEK